jgi:hypothetical protein
MRSKEQDEAEPGGYIGNVGLDLGGFGHHHSAVRGGGVCAMRQVLV